MTAYAFLRDLHQVCHFQTREGKKVGEASSSELRRWLRNQAVIIDGIARPEDWEVVFPIESFVLFPRSPVTLWDDKWLRP